MLRDLISWLGVFEICNEFGIFNVHLQTRALWLCKRIAISDIVTWQCMYHFEILLSPVATHRPITS